MNCLLLVSIIYFFEIWMLLGSRYILTFYKLVKTKPKIWFGTLVKSHWNRRFHNQPAEYCTFSDIFKWFLNTSLVMLVTTWFWWLKVGDRFWILMTEFRCWWQPRQYSSPTPIYPLSRKHERNSKYEFDFDNRFNFWLLSQDINQRLNAQLI